MTSSFAWVAVVFILLACLPMALKWLQRRMGNSSVAAAQASRVVSAIAVGPHQRVVTVEVGPHGDRTWLVLGVTAQSITCLHSLVRPQETEQGETPAHS